jgi:hypothetical protein
MAAHVTHRYGSMSPFVADDIDALLAELDAPADPENPDMTVTHESGWSLSAFPSERLIWQDLEGDGPAAHIVDVDRATARRLMVAVGSGDLAAVHDAGWSPGYG